jgi:hypothetical protein
LEIGEGVSVDLDASAPGPATGDLVIVVKESSSEEPVPDVTVEISGKISGSARTDSSGKAQFPGIPEGVYTFTLKQAEFEMSPSSGTASVFEGEEEQHEVTVVRVILTVVMKRIHIQGLLKAAFGNKDDLEYGHWWVEIDGGESYGWWPGGPVSLRGTFGGVPGALNGVPTFPGGTATRDPHHGDRADEMFNPSVLSGQSAAAVKSCLRGFAGGYSGSWSWPWGQNCHSLQESMMDHCRVSKGSSKKVS